MGLYAHQVIGRDRLVASKALLLGDEMRLGKTVQVVTAAEELYRRGLLDRVLVVAPAPARAVWADPDPAIGQVAKFAEEPTRVLEFKSGRMREWNRGEGKVPLQWIVTNYELVRVQKRLDTLLQGTDSRTALVFDESIALANYRSKQTRAAKKLRQKAGFAWLLNGTPSGDSPEAIFGQFFVLDDRVLGRYITHFRAAYAVMNPYGYKVNGRPVTIDRWVNLDHLAKLTAPYILRRTMDQVFDLPPKLDPVVREVVLSRETWAKYKSMKQEALVWLDTNRAATAFQAGVKALRLGQITSGILGGIEDVEGARISDVEFIGREKLDSVINMVDERIAQDPNWKGLLWTRFRPEAERLERELAKGRITTRLLVGSQAKDVREEAVRLLNPDRAPKGPAALVGTEATGKYAFNFAASADVSYVSNEWSLIIRDQSEARVLGSAQDRSVLYTDVCAVGPNGEKTVDHVVVRGLRDKRTLASMTADEWLAALEEE